MDARNCIIVRNELVPLNTKQPNALLHTLFPPAPAASQDESHIRQWIRMMDSLDPADDKIDLLPVDEDKVQILSGLIPTNSLGDTCFVRHSVLRQSNLGHVELCQVGKLVEDSTVQLVEPSRYVVVKAFDLQKFAATQENPMRELSFHRRLSKGSKHIMPLLACLASPTKLFAVYPYCNEGDLFNFLSTTDKLISEKQIRSFMKNMLSAIGTCHAAGVCHRDISLENFLVCNNGRSLILIDFGLSAEMDIENNYAMNNIGPVGKIKYMAPEIVCGKPAVIDGRKADIWSLGVTLFMLITKTEPFHVATSVDNRFKALVSKKGIKSVFASWGIHSSDSLVHLLQSMLSADPAERPSVEQILLHPWMTETA